jgi:hypothetical protein
MIAAIYARKSTEQAGVSDEAKSITRRSSTGRPTGRKKAGLSPTTTSTWTTASAGPSSSRGATARRRRVQVFALRSRGSKSATGARQSVSSNGLLGPSGSASPNSSGREECSK